MKGLIMIIRVLISREKRDVTPFHETVLLLLICVNVPRSIARQLSELGQILLHSHRPLLQTEELLPLELDHSSWDMMRSEVIPKL